MTTTSNPLSTAEDAAGYLQERSRVRPHPVFNDDALHNLLAACAAWAAQARQVHKLADTVTMDVRVPYDPPLLDLWEQAEPLLAAEFIGLDWSDWQVWTVDRSLIGDDWTPDTFVLYARGEYRVGVSWIGLGLQNATVNRVEPELARRAAARLLAIAELAERRQATALEGGVRP